MALEIIWTPRAKKTFYANVEYLRHKWSQKEIDAFIYLTDQKIENISNNPHLGRQHTKGLINVRFSLVHKRVALIYRYKPLKKEIELLTFWGTRQNPKKVRFK